MIKFVDILKEVLNFEFPIEEPSYFPTEDKEINNYVNIIVKIHPKGIKANNVFQDLPDVDVRLQLKILIELAKRKLLNFGLFNGKVTPEEVLKIYGNPKHSVPKNISMNE